MKKLKNMIWMCMFSLVLGVMAAPAVYAAEVTKDECHTVDLLSTPMYLIDEDGNVMPVPYSEVTLGGITIANGVTAVWFGEEGLWADANTGLTWKIYTDVPATYSTWAQSLDGRNKYDFGFGDQVHGTTYTISSNIKVAGYYKYCLKNTSATDLTIKKCTITY